MRTIKLAVVLPVLQFLLAAGLLEAAYAGRSPFPAHGDELYVPTSRLICLGMNAPAWVFTILLSGLPLPDLKVFRLYTSDLEFLVFVAAVWFFVGNRLDKHFARSQVPLARTSVKVLGSVLLMIFGVVLFVMALGSLRSPEQYNNVLGNVLEGILFLAWSFLLIIWPGRQLLTRS